MQAPAAEPTAAQGGLLRGEGIGAIFAGSLTMVIGILAGGVTGLTTVCMSSPCPANPPVSVLSEDLLAGALGLTILGAYALAEGVSLAVGLGGGQRQNGPRERATYRMSLRFGAGSLHLAFMGFGIWLVGTLSAGVCFSMGMGPCAGPAYVDATPNTIAATGVALLGIAVGLLVAACYCYLVGEAIAPARPGSPPR
jgi:hypothetical protein